MEYIKYEKTFVMLTGQNGEFAQRESVPAKGHIKIETGSGKGAMRVGVQNLRFFEKREYIYKLILFGKRKELTIHAVVGTVAVNRYGSGETYFRFDPRNLDGKGSRIGDFYYAIVAAVSMRNEKEPLHPVLKGNLEIAEDTEEEADRGERGEGGNAVYAENGDAALVKAAGVTPEEAAEDKEAAGVTEQAKPMCFNDYYNKYLLQCCRRLESKAEYQDDVAPFHQDETGAIWKKIVNVNTFPLISPAGRYFATKYRHYIFGAAEKQYYLGVPGRFLREEQPEGGESGFVFWQPIAGAEKLRATEAGCSEENRKSAYGYWIVAVDRQTGDVLEV